MKKGVILPSLIGLLAMSCSVQELDTPSAAPSEDDVFYASLESASGPDTKVYIDEDIKILWDEGDRISIFNKTTLNQQFKFAGETGDNSGFFSRVSAPSGTGSPLGYVCAVYPYQSSTSMSSSGVLSLTLPAVQPYREDTFGLGANTMVSATETNTLNFKNVGGYLALKFYGDDVTIASIKLEGNNGERLSGKATVRPSVGADPNITMSSTAGTSITLNCENPVDVGTTKEDATIFWMVVPPTNFTKGFKLTVTDPDGNVYVKETSANLSIARNGVLRIAAIEAQLPKAHQSEYASQYLTFEIVEGGTITWKVTSNDIAKTIEYSINGGNWNRLTSSTSGASFNVSTGDRVRFRGNNTRYATGIFSYNNFTTTCKFNVIGNIMSLVAGDGFKSATALSSTYVFERLFYQCSGLLSAEKMVLAATTLTNYCYEGLFYNCSSLNKAPDLPAKTLTDFCYRYMFFGCKSLESAPKLPATTVGKDCYTMMFGECSSLKSAPALPATTMANYCYSSMFQNCTALTTAPQLPATTLASNCYAGMFTGCTALTAAPTLPATTLATRCYSSMFDGCTKLSSITCLATNISATNCLQNWVNNVSSSGTFTKASSMSSWPRGTNGIPQGWTVKNQ
ncbi:MAG: leucine-rich repeat protein [Bacteroidales bacterium]|nr:leucine-rich repeat protein [Bacteroidales bacterium]MBR2228529.1 leucine-rich repeat protein [Bacteroidales bacterium]